MRNIRHFTTAFVAAAAGLAILAGSALADTEVKVSGTNLNVTGGAEANIIEVKFTGAGKVSVQDSAATKLAVYAPCERAKKANGNPNPQAVVCPKTVKAVALAGSDGNDIMVAGVGFTLPISLSGGRGDDRLIGGNGNDVIDGGPGSDYPNSGGNGNDWILDSGTDNQEVDYGFGGAGDDIITFDVGRDHAIDGTGADRIYMGYFQDYVSLVNDSSVDQADCGRNRPNDPIDVYELRDYLSAYRLSQERVTNCEVLTDGVS